MLWRRDSFELVQSLTHIHWIFTKLRHKESGIQVSIFNIYITVFLSKKKECWQSIQDVLDFHHPENLILAGDMNIILSTKEKKVGSIVMDPLRETLEDIMRD